MKRLSFVLVMLLALLLSLTGVVYGNALALQAENGKILAPAGFGLDLSGAFLTGRDPSPLYSAQLSYGVTPAITIAGVWMGNFKDGYDGQKLLKALFSPNHEQNGYTIYGDYDLTQSKVACYGISLWTDYRFLYAYTNLESRNTIADQTSGLVLTPGVNVKLGSRLSLAAEAEYKTANWSGQELRVGAAYRLNRKIAAKFQFETGLADQPDRVYQTGLSVEL
ncbi:MAG TPA: hypothetical protein DDW65_19225 [Firmicutes bacterium]|jgi:hypothetical protein|nr:hypothetical protein [Bacillota bacterium]